MPMKFVKKSLSGVILIEPEVFRDERGSSFKYRVSIFNFHLRVQS